MIVSNALADLLYANEAVAPKPYKNKSHKYARGMSITKILPLVKKANVTMAENSMQNPIIIVLFSPQIFIAGLTKTP